MIDPPTGPQLVLQSLPVLWPDENAQLSRRPADGLLGGQSMERKEGVVHVEDDPVLEARQIDSVRASLEQLEEQGEVVGGSEAGLAHDWWVKAICCGADFPPTGCVVLGTSKGPDRRRPSGQWGLLPVAAG
jgi:hypothetical protein